MADPNTPISSVEGAGTERVQHGTWAFRSSFQCPTIFLLVHRVDHLRYERYHFAQQPHWFNQEHAFAQGARFRWPNTITPRSIRKCLSTVASTLTLLVITDYHYNYGGPQPWENSTISDLNQLKTLVFNGVPVTAPLLAILPRRIEHLRFSGATLKSLPAPEIAKWLRTNPFPHRGVLKKLEVVGELRANYNGTMRILKTTDSRVEDIAKRCGVLGIEWVHEVEGF